MEIDISNSPPMLSTGFQSLDKILAGGLKPGELATLCIQHVRNGGYKSNIMLSHPKLRIAFEATREEVVCDAEYSQELMESSKRRLENLLQNLRKE